MTKLKPVGSKIIIEELGNKNATTESGIEIVNLTLGEGKVIEVSDYLKNIYKEGDIVLYPKGSGTEHTYNGVICKFLDGQEYPLGNVWAISVQQSTPKDNGDNL